MTDRPDQPGRPAWPGQQPQPAPQPAAVPAWAAVPPAGAPPAAVEAPAARTGRGIDLKLVIAVLIGLVSVTGAVVAWQSSLAGEKATDKDRQAVAESVIVAQAGADTEIILQDARARFAEHLASVVAIERLEADRQVLLGNGDEASALDLAEDIAEQEVLARRVLEGASAPVLLNEYVVAAAEGEPPTFDEERLGDDLTRIASEQNRVNPSQTVREANRLRSESQWLDGWLIALVGAVVLLTLAQVSRHRLSRLVLAGAGTAVWIVATVIAFGGR
jgi:hypothetical protein